MASRRRRRIWLLSSAESGGVCPSGTWWERDFCQWPSTCERPLRGVSGLENTGEPRIQAVGDRTRNRHFQRTSSFFVRLASNKRIQATTNGQRQHTRTEDMVRTRWRVPPPVPLSCSDFAAITHPPGYSLLPCSAPLTLYSSSVSREIPSCPISQQLNCSRSTKHARSVKQEHCYKRLHDPSVLLVASLVTSYCTAVLVVMLWKVESTAESVDESNNQQQSEDIRCEVRVDG